MNKFLFVTLFFLSTSVLALNCKDSGVFTGGKMMAGICWDCFFPMEFSGISMDAPNGEGSGGKPPGSYNGAACVCTDDLGIPAPGLHIGMWDITHAIETVTTPYCSPFLGGTNLSGSTRMAVGGDINGGEPDNAFLHLHVWTFPVAQVLQMFAGVNCNPGNLLEVDMSYISEPDPLWNDEILTTMIQPESLIFSTIVSQLACVGECAAMYVSDNVNLAPWCVGCWGGAYPSTGFDVVGSDLLKLSSILAVKSINAMHRRFLLHKTYGSDAMCSSYLFPSLLKEQYRLGYVFPGVEGTSNHEMGSPTITWGSGMTRPDASGQSVQVLYRYKDCCTLIQ